MTAQPGQFLPVFTAVLAEEQGSILHAGIDCLGISKGRFQVPHPLEFPGMGSAVIPLVGGQGLAGFFGHVVNELVAGGLGHGAGFGYLGRGAGLFPGLAAVVGALDDLAKPVGGLGYIEAIGVYRGAGEVIDLPAAEKRPLYLPLLALAVGFQDERAFARTDQHSNLAHSASGKNSG